MARVLLLLALPLLIGGSIAEDWLRRGNAAYERSDYDAAVAAYAEAEVRTTEPGLAAFNKAAALYHHGRYREAELSYRCCLEDAAGPRRTFALYGLGSALVQQGRERGAEALREAIRSFEESMRQPGVSPELADDARHDVELAKLLLQLVPPKTDDKPSTQRDDEEEKPHRSPERQRPDPGMESLGKGKADARAEKQRVGREHAKDAQRSDEGTAGAGSELPPVPDQEELAPMSRDDAKEHLKRAAARILDEQRTHARTKRIRGNVENGLDW